MTALIIVACALFGAAIAGAYYLGRGHGAAREAGIWGAAQAQLRAAQERQIAEIRAELEHVRRAERERYQIAREHAERDPDAALAELRTRTGKPWPPRR